MVVVHTHNYLECIFNNLPYQIILNIVMYPPKSDIVYLSDPDIVNTRWHAEEADR